MTRTPLLSQLSRTNLAWMALLVLTTAIGLAIVPLEQSLPIHWDFQGQADGFAPGWLAVLLPCLIGLGFVGALLLIFRFSREKDFEAARAPIDVTLSSVLALFVYLEAVFIYIGQGGTLSVPKVAVIGAGLMLLILGNIMPKSQPSWLSGLPLSWTGNDPDIWRTTQRWYAWAHIFSGFALIAWAFVGIKGPSYPIGVIIAVLLPLLIASLLAYRLVQKKKSMSSSH